MTRQDLRKKGVDIIIHPVLIGLDEGERKKMYSFSIFDNEDEIGSMQDNPDFDTYEQAEEWAVESAVTWVKTQQN